VEFFELPLATSEEDAQALSLFHRDYAPAGLDIVVLA
jgi:hypothetical protein